MLTRRTLLLSAGALAAMADGASGQAAAPSVRPVFQHDLPDLNLSGWSATAVEVSYGPGEASGAHRHPGLTIAYVLEGIATLTCLEEKGDEAVVYLGAAQALRRQIGSPVAPVVQAELSRIISPATTGLSPPEYEAALRQARTRPLGEIVASILE